MIPSDHFVRFYNEVFKFLDRQGGLEKYYQYVSRHQEQHCLKAFQEHGLKGIHEYYEKIVREENCDMDNILHDHEVILDMKHCPSLGKVLDNDAGACPKYCLHCPGWTAPLYAKAGLYQVYDLMGLDQPRCREYIYDRIEDARRKYQELRQIRPAQELRCNFPTE